MKRPASIMCIRPDKTAMVCSWCNEHEKLSGILTGNDWSDDNGYDDSHGVCQDHAREMLRELKRPA